MRLTCPNCEAQYEVPDDVVPDEGRDVQCSNCGNTWYQLHPAQEAAIEANRTEMTPVEAPASRPAPSPAPRPRAVETPQPAAPAVVEPRRAPPPPPPVADPIPDPVPEAAMIEIDDDFDDIAFDDEPPAPPPPQRKMDPRVRDVLKAEAAREERLRAAPPDALESQPDLGLEPPETARTARMEREASMALPDLDDAVDTMADRASDLTDAARAKAAAVGASAAAVAATAAASRKDLLPDVDEINSTLRSDSERRDIEADRARDDMEAHKPDTGSVFGQAFRWGLLFVVLLAALYIFAPRLIEWFPAITPVLEPYVSMVDGILMGLQGLIGGGGEG